MTPASTTISGCAIARIPTPSPYLEAENAYTKEKLQHTEALQAALYAEMLGRIQQTDLSVPVKRDEYFYYTRTEEGKQYAIHCRKKGAGPEEILLDCNLLAEGHKYFRLGAFIASPNHRLLAYSVDFEGDEKYTVRVKNLDTGELLADEIPNTSYTLEWAADNATFFYTILDEALRPYKVFRHALGVKEDPLIYHEPDERFTLDLSSTRSRAYIFININSSLTSEVRYLRKDQPTGEFRVLLPRVLRNRVRRHPSRRLVLHPHQRWRQGLPRGRSAGGRSRESQLEGNHPRPRGHHHRKRHRVSGLPGDRRAPPRLDADLHSRHAHRRAALHRISRAGLYRGTRRQRRVQHQTAALPLHVAGHARRRSTTTTWKPASAS